VAARLGCIKARATRSGENPVPNKVDEARVQVARANRIIANEGVLDAFGHVSMRHPTDPGRYLLSRSRAPELVEPEDVLEFTLDSEPVKPPTTRLYSERVIHGEIYKARPEVLAVCHHHAASILPFCISGVELKPVYHLGATMGEAVPFWDCRDEFGDTNLLVQKPEEGASLARTLGDNWTVLMRRHGATVAGRSLEELVFRTIYTVRNATLQLQAHVLGHVSSLNGEETRLGGDYNLQPGPVARAFEYWSVRLDKVEGLSPARKAPAKKTVAPKKAAAKPARAAKRAKAKRR
jgi:ribulose-5-phosphate 4-epimerase/fuculose-1-phosphate aldolase